MKKYKNHVGRGGLLITAMAFLAAVVYPAVGPTQSASAGTLTSRKVTLASSADGNTVNDSNGIATAAGSGGNGAQTRHTFNFTTPNTTNIGSVAFMYCTTPFIDTTCTPPTGMDSSTLTSIQQQTTTAAFSFDTATNTTTASGTGYFANDTNACTAGTGRTNCILVNKGTTNSETAGAKQFTFGNTGTDWIKNPTGNGTYYVRVLTFTDNAYTTLQDSGTVAFAITDEINIEAKVQEQLKFSVSSSAATVEGAACDALTGNALIALGSSGVLDAATAYDAHSFFRVSTNAATGTAVQYAGNTLRTATGGYTITAPAGPTASTVGSEQFGFQFNTGNAGYSDEHLTTLTAAYAGGTTANGTITNGGTAQFGYSTASLTAPVTIATSGAQVVTCSTLAVRYIANISPTTEPGIYRTTIAYIATPTY